MLQCKNAIVLCVPKRHKHPWKNSVQPLDASTSLVKEVAMNTHLTLPSYKIFADSFDGNGLAHAVYRLVERVDSLRRYNRTRRELLALSDAELLDIGLERADIENIARNC